MKGENFRQAFTIIEIMLVLAIVGLLFVGLISSAQSTIRKQRYNDSVQTFENILQEQYDLVSNVQNSRGQTERIVCSKTTTSVNPVAKENNKDAYAPGMSDCLVYGRLIEFSDMKQGGKREIKVSNVIGLDPGEIESSADQGEVSILKNALVSKEKIGSTERSEIFLMQWSSWLRNPRAGSATPAVVSGGLLILRSPASGTIWTYRYSDDIKSGVALRDKVSVANIGGASFCVMSDDADPKATRAIIAGGSGMFSGANSSAVQIAPLDSDIGKPGDFNYVPKVDCT
ncbi:MAG: type II secretion system GspH family protein [Candidatus Nomurabacteria bacterium]|jgi:prepilin-type N-terminal cleavage/methylation domain-containing protein|nr:type II secretion system GspH family protein [Candidatus Nomurabacteria bacterium]